MEKKVLLASNANLDIYDNTLTKFKNRIPKNYITTYKKWKLGIESISCNCIILCRNKVVIC